MGLEEFCRAGILLMAVLFGEIAPRNLDRTLSALKAALKWLESFRFLNEWFFPADSSGNGVDWMN